PGTRPAPHLLEPLRRAEAAIGRTRFEQAGRRLVINRLALRLDERRLIPGHAEPAQALFDLLLAARNQAGAGSVSDTQQERPAFLPREQIIEEGRAGAAEVQGARRAGVVADTDRLDH